MEKSEVFKSGQTETAINVSGTLADHEKVKRKGPQLYHKENQFRAKAIEEIIRENANLSKNYENDNSYSQNEPCVCLHYEPLSYSLHLFFSSHMLLS